MFTAEARKVRWCCCSETRPRYELLCNTVVVNPIWWDSRSMTLSYSALQQCIGAVARQSWSSSATLSRNNESEYVLALRITMTGISFACARVKYTSTTKSGPRVPSRFARETVAWICRYKSRQRNFVSSYSSDFSPALTLCSCFLHYRSTPSLSDISIQYAVTYLILFTSSEEVIWA